MNDSKSILDRINSGNASWSDFSAVLDFDKTELKSFFLLSQEHTKKIFNNTLKIYNPTKRFPAISITGGECSLHCEHCDEKYLKGMKSILTNKELEKFLMQHSKEKGIGILLSGGCDPNGAVPLINFLDTIKNVKKKTNLIINTHTGLLDEETAQKLAEAKVDIVSFDINLDKEVIENIYHLNKDINNYKHAVSLLKKYQLNIVPHICIGLYYGKLHKELDSLKFIKEVGINPALIVLIALIPPKNSNGIFQTPNPIDIAKIIAVARFIFPFTEISLGCMRPRGKIKIELEKYAIKAGINRIELPSPETLKWVKTTNPEIKFKYFSACCAIPNEYENLAKSKNSDIKRYLSI